MTTKITITQEPSGHDVVVVVLGEARGGSHIEQSRHLLVGGTPSEFYIHRYQVLSIEEVK